MLPRPAAPSTTVIYPFNLPMARSVDPDPAGAQLVRMLGCERQEGWHNLPAVH